MEVRLATPGHAPPLDTFIALGVANGILEAHPTAKLNVKKRGSSYEIRIEADRIDWESVYAALADQLTFEAKRLYNRTGDIFLAFGPQRSPSPEELSVQLERLVEEVRELVLRLPSEYSEGSRHVANEGKSGHSKSSRSYTAYLPLAPWAGKYFASTYSYKEGAYRVCPLCYFLAWSGLLTSSAVVEHRRKGKWVVYYVAPDPVDVEGADLALLSLIFREKRRQRRRIREEVPALALPLLVLATGETLWPVIESSFGLFMWTYEKAGQSLGVRRYSQLPLKPLLDFIAKAKARGRHLARLVEYLSVRDPVALAQITECLAYGKPEPYDVVRGVWSLIEQEKDRRYSRLLEREFAEALFDVWREYWASQL